MTRGKRYPKLLISPWNWELTFFYDVSYSDAHLYLTGMRDNNPIAPNIAALTMLVHGTNRSAVWLTKVKRMDSRAYNILGHEALHTTFAIMNEVGMKYSVDSEEAYCYVHGEILAFLVKQLSKRVK